LTAFWDEQLGGAKLLTAWRDASEAALLALNRSYPESSHPRALIPEYSSEPVVQRICVDMDEVMADTLAEHLRRYNEAFDEAITVQDLAGKQFWEVAPFDRQQQLRAFLDAEDFFEDLPLIPGAQETLKDLSERFEIFVASQAMVFPNSLGPKYRWLQRHFSFIPPMHYVFCGDKSILRADYLIDDLPRNLLSFQGQGLLFTAHHNLGATDFLRVDNWNQISDYFAGVPG
jgi:5'-nucleotidase